MWLYYDLPACSPKLDQEGIKKVTSIEPQYKVIVMLPPEFDALMGDLGDRR
jgi:hypothetical protein